MNRPSMGVGRQAAAATAVLAVVVGAVAAGAVIAQQSGSEATARAGLVGLWLLDDRYSDDPVEKAEELLSARGNRLGGSFPGGGFGNQRGRQGGARSGSGPAGKTPAELVRYLARGLQVLKIELTGEYLALHDANRVTRLLLVDGRPTGDALGNRTTARFSGGVLTVTTQTDRGQLAETFELAEGGAQLVRTLDLQGGRLPDLQFRSVYERVTDNDATETAAEPTEPETARLVSAPKVPDAAAGSGAPDGEADAEPPPILRGLTLRLLPPAATPGSLLSGKVLMQTLTIDPSVATVEFSVDGETVARQKRAPFDAKVTLADPPREQVVKATAFSESGRRLGTDEIIVNRVDPPFRVRLTGIDGLAASGSVTARAEVSVPRLASLEEVRFFLTDTEIARLTEEPFVADIPTQGSDPQTDYIRVVAKLEDGRLLEDVKLLQGADFSEVLDVHLVQLQVLVTDKRGTPVTGLSATDFEIVDHGKTYPVDRLYLAQDVALVLGLAIDSSGSMAPLWHATQSAAQQFLESTLQKRDRAFLVDFDSNLRLLQSLTGDKGALFDALGRLVPRGGTALYDSILFSLLQFNGEPGRRALIVLTDGFDSESRADPNRAIDFGVRLGVPVYAITMTAGQGVRMPSRSGFSNADMARGALAVVTDPTGGRLFRAGSTEQVSRAFAQIRDELRKQYVLTYYSEAAPEAGVRPRVKIRRKGLVVRTALPLDLAD